MNRETEDAIKILSARLNAVETAMLAMIFSHPDPVELQRIWNKVRPSSLDADFDSFRAVSSAYMDTLAERTGQFSKAINDCAEIAQSPGGKAAK